MTRNHDQSDHRTRQKSPWRDRGQLDAGIFRGSLEQNVFYPYGDVFMHKGVGALVIGQGGMGKSVIVNTFEELYSATDVGGAVVLGEDDPAIYKPKNEKVHPVSYFDDDIRTKDKRLHPLVSPFSDPGCKMEYPIKYLFHLIGGDDVRIVRNGDRLAAIKQMSFDENNYSPTDTNWDIVSRIFEEVQFVDIYKNNGYNRQESLLLVESIRTILEEEK